MLYPYVFKVYVVFLYISIFLIYAMYLTVVGCSFSYFLIQFLESIGIGRSKINSEYSWFIVTVMRKWPRRHYDEKPKFENFYVVVGLYLHLEYAYLVYLPHLDFQKNGYWYWNKILILIQDTDLCLQWTILCYFCN